MEQRVNTLNRKKSGAEKAGKIYQISNDHNLINNEDKNMFENAK